MIFEKTLNYLKEFVKKADPDKKFINDMKKLLSKLKDRAKKLEFKLEKEKNEKKRKNINLILKVIYKQEEKGKKLIQEREMSSHSSRKHKFIIKPTLSPPIL